MSRDTISSDDIVAHALAIAEADGVANLTMRKLAAGLGVAVTSIYWHIGNRDALLDAMIESEMAGWKAVRPSGSTPRTRIISFARILRRRLLSRRNMVELVSERGRIFEIFVPTYETLATEFLDAGLGHADAALAVRTIELHVVGSVILQRRVESDPERYDTALTGPDSGAGAAEVVRRALSIPSEAAFDAATGILVSGLLESAT